jgi:CheY-like chemotaxis protein
LLDFLGPLGFEMLEADDGQSALARAERFLPDLIIMDSVMPVMDGLIATWRLRAMPAFKETPIIAASASVSDSDKDKALAVGSNTFLSKPIEFNDLLDEIGRLLRLHWIYAATSDTSGGPARERPGNTAGSVEGSGTLAPMSGGGSAVPRAAVLALLPALSRSALREALIQLDADAVARAIDTIRTQDARVAQGLATLAGDFQYERILQLLDAADGRSESVR